MRCEFCNKRLGIIQRLKGQTYCSVEHQELHFSMGFERLRASLSDFTAEKPELKPLEPKADLVPAKVEQAPPVQPEPKLELPPAELLLEPQAKEAARETSRTLEIASLVEAVGKTTAIELPEAPFLLELPARQDQPAAPLISYAGDLVSAAVRLPASLTQEPPLRTLPSLVLDVSPVAPPVEVPPVTGQATWRSVPEGYPPVVVSASATLLLDSKGAKLIPLQIGDPCRGQGPVPPPLPQSAALETPLRQPRLVPRQTDRLPASVFTPPPQAPAMKPLWEGQAGSVPVLPPQTGILRPQRDVLRPVPPVRRGNFGALSIFPFFAAEPAVPVPPKQALVALAPYFPVTIVLRRGMRRAQASLMSRTPELAKAFQPLAIESAPLRAEPSAREIESSWQRIAVAGELPRAAAVRLPGPLGLNPATAPVPLECSSVESLPPAVETAAAVASPVPFLLLSRPYCMPARALPVWSDAQPLSHQACRLPMGVSERQWAQSMANLHPSVPSPLSLVTWSQSLSISIPARNPSNLGGPAPIRWTANQGRAHAVRLSPPSWRGHRITPLRPQPCGIPWAPVAPMQASLRPPVVEPIRPGSGGTAPPSLNTVRAKPASMPVLPPPAAPFGIEPVNGLVLSGLASEDNLELACMDMACETVWEPRAESSTVLPPLPARRNSHVIAPPLSGHQVRWDAIPPVQSVNSVAPFSDLQRLARSLSAVLPGAGEPVRKSAGWLADGRLEAGPR